MVAVAACTPTIASAYAGSTGPLGMSLVIPMRALCSFESLVLISGRRVQHTRCTAREKCVHPRAQHPRVPRGEHSSYILMYPELASSWSFIMITGNTFPQRKRPHLVLRCLTVRWAKAINY